MEVLSLLEDEVEVALFDETLEEDLAPPQEAKIMKAGRRIKNGFFIGNFSFPVSDFIVQRETGYRYAKIYAVKVSMKNSFREHLVIDRETS